MATVIQTSAGPATNRNEQNGMNRKNTGESHDLALCHLLGSQIMHSLRVSLCKFSYQCKHTHTQFTGYLGSKHCRRHDWRHDVVIGILFAFKNKRSVAIYCCLGLNWFLLLLKKIFNLLPANEFSCFPQNCWHYCVIGQLSYLMPLIKACRLSYRTICFYCIIIALMLSTHYRLSLSYWMNH